jgi:hypothetical protein
MGAIERLKITAPLELGYVPLTNEISCLWTNYVRGEAFIAAGRGSAAATEFQKILDHTGIVQNCETGALAYLGLARASALQSRTNSGVAANTAHAKAIAAYEQFFSLWQDADPDIPILKQAKLEYETVK